MGLRRSLDYIRSKIYTSGLIFLIKEETQVSRLEIFHISLNNFISVLVKNSLDEFDLAVKLML